MNDLHIAFAVTQTPQQVFEAVNNVRGWWSESLEGESARQGDEFVYRHGDVHFSRHRLTDVIPNQKVVWLTTDSSLNFVDNKQEWNGTTIDFIITETNGQTTLDFTHMGLTPAQACYTACSSGWAHYIESLRQLITSGKGQPDAKNS